MKNSSGTTSKRLLLVSAVGNNKWSGMGKWSYKIAEALENDGNKVTLWFRDDLPTLSMLGRMGKYFTPFGVAWKILKNRNNFDCVIVHEPSASIYTIVRRFMGKRLPPVICMCHNVESHCFRTIATATQKGFAATSLKNKILFHLFNRWLSDCSIWWADRIICLSTVDRRYIVEKLGRKECDVSLMVNGVDQQYFGERVSRKKEGLPTVLFVGGWLDVKGRFVLPKIWKKVSDKLPDARLTIVGSGQPAEVVLGWFAENARPSVTVVTRVDTEAEIQAFYQTHDIFLMPSLTEGSPLSMLEAMANGMAIVGSRAGGIPDVVPQEEASGGILFPSCDTERASQILIELLQNPSKVAELGGCARIRAQESDWRQSARVIIDSLNSLPG